VGTASLVLGFGTALAMWIAGFVGRLPAVSAPAWILGPLLVGLLLCGGVLAGRRAGGALAGAATGAVASLVNLLVLGSLVSSETPNTIAPSSALWIPGSILLGALAGAAGGAIGRTRKAVPDTNWVGVFAKIAALATFVLVMLGGIVTSEEAGLAVVDWPNSYGYNMFLYPLSRMVGGIYYEHAHRLFGSLVGLTTLALAVLLFRKDGRGWARGVGAAAVVLVVLQGILGGLRVTGHFTMADSPEITRPSLALAMVHGVTGQVFLAVMVAVAAFASRSWRDVPPATTPSAGTDHALSAALLASLLIQLLLGVRVRHTGEGTMEHVAFAVFVLALAVAVSARLLGKYDAVPVLRKTGSALIAHAGTQVVLGFLAFVAVGRRGNLASPPSWEVAVTTAHQAFGALLLANATLAFLWCRRLLVAPRPAESPPELAR
jgi:cytochrome c oxidase assembly protein subunit 15